LIYITLQKPKWKVGCIFFVHVLIPHDKPQINSDLKRFRFLYRKISWTLCENNVQINATSEAVCE